jgi:hypothetical protein
MAESLNVIQLWALAWPEVPWMDASPEDKKLFLDHSNSLYWYHKEA